MRAYLFFTSRVVFFKFSLYSLCSFLQMEVPFDYHRSIIGQKGQSIRELSDTHNVHIEIPNSEEHLDIIKVHRIIIKRNQIIYLLQISTVCTLLWVDSWYHQFSAKIPVPKTGGENLYRYFCCLKSRCDD